ncbi:MAG: hypothetical protein JF597_09110 [Streptomyces sp.]|uniref:hypothetical protein n=1 Tax=Streptomyces sp. TaxID=1931 RepID=UPI0025D5873B|nr:hypothetical protein [Streptomyces sp.]MBW8793732.1 hypothetical protein [Streptomyces sp.]
MGEKQDGKPVPRDLPDQQAGSGQDPWEAAESGRPEVRRDDDLPDLDEAGAGPHGTPRSGSAHPEKPVPDEPTA